MFPCGREHQDPFRRVGSHSEAFSRLPCAATSKMPVESRSIRLGPFCRHRDDEATCFRPSEEAPGSLSFRSIAGTGPVSAATLPIGVGCVSRSDASSLAGGNQGMSFLSPSLVHFSISASSDQVSSPSVFGAGSTTFWSASDHRAGYGHMLSS